MNKKLMIIFLICILSFHSRSIALDTLDFNSNDFVIEKCDIVLVSNTDPYYAILASSVSCFYESNNESILKPMLICEENYSTSRQKLFMDRYLKKQGNVICIGAQIDSPYESLDFIGNPIDVSLDLFTHFDNYLKVLLLPYGNVSSYDYAISAAPIASYEHIPIVLYDNNIEEIEEVLAESGVEEVILVGNNMFHLPNDINIIHLNSVDNIQRYVIYLIKERFNEINYLTLTNPKDIIKIEALSTSSEYKNIHINTKQLTIFGRTFTIHGSPEDLISFSVPNGLYHLEIFVNLTNKNELFFKNVEPYMKITVTDSIDRVISYASTNSYEPQKIFVDSIICNQTGNYSIKLNFFHGLKGGFFSVRGFSHVDFEVNVTVQLTSLSSPHFPKLTSLSSMSPYLASAHGGIVVSNTSFSPFTDEYKSIAKGFATGPWYEAGLHDYNNKKVNDTIAYLEKQMFLLEEQELLEGYLQGPAWLGILGDTNMIPMYYYRPNQPGIPEKGLPSDNPYMLNETLSVGRIMGYNLSDVSLLIGRTFFYETLCQFNDKESSVLSKFHFMYGEGFGETGGFFHQIPYAKEVESYGFDSTVFGIMRNSRQYAESEDIFTGANYNEYLGHADWFWFSPSLYGLDMYSKVFDVAHVKNWKFEIPSIFLTSACLMGRVDGLSPWMNIGMTLIHAGCNGFVGATRETGQEAGLETFENHLIIDDYSMGEALRGEKQVDKELPTYYVRTLFGDPAFNPYEPNNGFHNQGRPN